MSTLNMCFKKIPMCLIMQTYNTLVIHNVIFPRHFSSTCYTNDSKIETESVEMIQTFLQSDNRFKNMASTQTSKHFILRTDERFQNGVCRNVKNILLITTVVLDIQRMLNFCIVCKTKITKQLQIGQPIMAQYSL